MAATEVIRFCFLAQAVHRLHLSFVHPSFLFEHSPTVILVRLVPFSLCSVLPYRRDMCVSADRQPTTGPLRSWAETRI
jgi:hypothetical protein